MTSRDFCYWLQGYFELSGGSIRTKNQTDIIKSHLAMVFAHEIDPSFGGEEVQETLNELHHGDVTIGGTGPSGIRYRC